MERRKVLIVDDVEFFLYQQVSYLGSERFDIEIARTGQEALEKVQHFSPDLILMDHFMPEMDGEETCRRLKDNPATRKVPVVIMSSGPVERSRVAIADSTGCDGIISKPIRRDILLATVENLLGMYLRKAERVSVDLPCLLKIETQEHEAVIISISSDGAFISTPLSQIVGDHFSLRFDLPGREKPIVVRTALVAWAGQRTEGGPEGCGVRFLAMDTAARQAVQRYVESRIRGSDRS